MPLTYVYTRDGTFNVYCYVEHMHIICWGEVYIANLRKMFKVILEIKEIVQIERLLSTRYTNDLDF